MLLYEPDLFFTERVEKHDRKDYFDIGSAVDLLCAKGNLIDIENSVTFIEKRISGKLYDMVIFLLENELEPTDENILYAREAVKYDGRLKPGSVIEKFITDGGLWYYETLVENKNKILLTEDEWGIVKNVFTSLKTNIYTKKYLDPQPNTIRLNHVRIFYTYLGVNLKAELDQVDIDVEARTVTPIDYKSMSESTRMFSSVAKKRRYDIQAASYTHAICEYVKENAESPDIGVDLTGFTVLPFRFVVETTNPSRIGKAPMVYECSKEFIWAGMWGSYPMNNRHIPSGPTPGDMFSITPLVPGFHTLMENYLYHTSTGERQYTKVEKEWYETIGAVPLYI